MKYKRRKFDSNSLKFKLWLYFMCFAALIMAVVWLAQVYMLNNSYEDMKTNQVNKFAQSISAQYRTGGFTDRFLNNIKTMASTNDIDVIFEDASGYTYYITQNTDEAYTGMTQQPAYSYIRERAEIKAQLEENGRFRGYTAKSPKSSGNYKTLVYGAYLDTSNGNEIILYLFAPLYPVSSTIAILRNQLVYVTVLALFLAFITAIWLTRRITKSFRKISESAVRLSKGEYGIDFPGEHYTEIIDLGDVLTYTSHELAKSDQLRRDLIANVSHDLKTPLTMVKSYAEMIRDLSGNNEQKRNEHLAVIIEETDRLNLLVDDMFTLSKMQSGVISLEISEFDFCEAVREIVHSYDILVEQEGYDIVLDVPETCTVAGDESKLKQVIANLVNNAVKYCGDDKYIYVAVRIDNDRGKVKFEVSDHGRGIAPEDLPHVWERYYRVSSNYHRSSKGTGLGLSIVREILKCHKAEYGADSRVGEGSTFWFALDTK